MTIFHWLFNRYDNMVDIPLNVMLEKRIAIIWKSRMNMIDNCSVQGAIDIKYNDHCPTICSFYFQCSIEIYYLSQFSIITFCTPMFYCLKVTPIYNLCLSVPPHQLLLYDNSGREITGMVGPLEEGSDLILTCEVRGGNVTHFFQFLL